MPWWHRAASRRPGLIERNQPATARPKVDSFRSHAHSMKAFLQRGSFWRSLGVAFALVLQAQPGLAQTISARAGVGLGDGGPGTAATLHAPERVAVDSAGNVYVADDGAYRVRKITPAGLISTFAGNGSDGSTGDGGAATAASVTPASVAVDSAGNLYIADSAASRVRKVSAATGIITTVAGNGSSTFSGDGGPAISAGVDPAGVAVDSAGNVYIADSSNQRVRKIAAATGVITTVAGNGSDGFAGDGGPATSASLSYPSDVALDAAGNLYVADSGNHRIRKVVPVTGVITTVAGSGVDGFSGDGAAATLARLSSPMSLALDAQGNLYIADTFNHRVRRVAAATGLIATVAGNGTNGFSGDGGAASAARLSYPVGVAIDSGGNVHIADWGNRRVRRVSATGVIATTAGVGIGDNGPATGAGVYSPRGVAFDTAGNLYYADYYLDRIRRIDGAGTITTIAGPGSDYFCGDGGPATSACLYRPIGIAAHSGSIYIADYGNHRIRKVASDGTITTVAGNGEQAFAGDGGAATSAKLNRPQAVAMGPDGSLYIADTANYRVRRVSTGGVITTFAGNGTRGFSGDGGPATSARLDWPSGIVLDPAGNLYIADGFSHRVRKVAAGTNVITTVAGNGTPGFLGDGGAATDAQLNYVTGVALDAQGNLYIADNGNNRIRRVQASTGVITTLAGTGSATASGNGGPATIAGLSAWHLALDSAGNLHFSDYENAAVRKVASDAAAPETTIALSPAAQSGSSIATFRFTGSDAGGATVFQCSLDGAAFTACGASATFTNLSLGSHTLLVRAVDGWGNADATPATYTWSVTQAAGTAALSAGMFYQCAVDHAGAVACWGDNGSGKLGTGEPLQSTLPITVGGIATSLTAIGASQNHTCALASDGKVLCWGGNYFGELGNGGFTSSGSPTLVQGLPGAASAIAVGSRHNCALTAGGAVHCWGMNRSGQLGNGELADQETTPVAVQGLSSGVVAIAAGLDHTCALTSAGALLCWGDNSSGQLGDGTTTNRLVPTPVSGMGSAVAAISAGTRHSCAIGTSGALSCWGQNLYGQLGNGTTTASNVPVRVPIATPVSSVSAGSWYTCAVTNGALFCWGTNHYDVLGTGAASSSTVSSPSAVSALATGVLAVSAGRTHACALRQGGTAFCWGYNSYGGVGDGTTTDRPTPVQVQGLQSAVTGITAGNFHSCGVTAERRAVCWGYNAEGQLGGGSRIGRATPIPVAGMSSGAVEVKSGIYHTCAVDANGAVKCWGQNFSGQLGNDSEVGSSSPVAVQGLGSGVASVAVGGKHSCAVTRAGGVLCWGDNSSKQLGGADVSRSDTPFPVEYLEGPVISIAAGWSYTCAANAAGAVFCWGTDTHGALGSGSTTSSEVPLRVTGLPADIVRVAGSLYHVCALAASGDIWCWGNNNNGQLGDGSYVDRSIPVKVVGLSAPAAKVSAGLYHTCALSNAGGVECWGYGGQGQIGDGFLEDSAYPVDVPSLPSGVLDIAAGTESCAATENGVVLCWAANNFGQVGDGTYVQREEPVTVLARNGGGSLDTNDWYLDLIPTKAKTIAKQLTPSVLTISQLVLVGEGSGLDTTVKYKSAEFGRNLQNYVFALVPPQFFSLVKTAPGAATEAQLRAKSGKSLVFAQLTPLGWTNLQGQLIAYSQGVASAAGGAASILNGVRLDLIPGSRFCVGYGGSATEMLTSDTFREVLVVEGAASTVEGRACVLSGVYLDGPRGSRLGTPVTFTANVVGLSPTGTVQFLDGPVSLLSPAALEDSPNPAVRRAAITTAALAAGMHSIGASYSGDSQNPQASAPILLHEVSAATVSTRIEIDGPRDSLSGTPVAFWATVSGSNPTGSVQFRDGGANLGAPVGLVGGTATVRIDNLATGSHSIAANYLGDAANAAGASNVIVHNVYQSIATRVALASSANPSTFGSAITFTVTVTGNNPGGQVVLREGATVLARVTLANGAASATLTGLAVGTHLIEADYGGDGSNQAVTSSVLLQQVNAAPQATTANVFLASSANPSAPGQSVTFTATVSGAGASPTGTVVLKAGSLTLCSMALASGSAACDFAALPPGVHLVTASYSGDAAYGASQSSLLSQTVTDATALLAASPATLDFASQGINTTSQALLVTLSNPTGAAVTFTGTALPPGVVASGASTCGAILAAGASCQMGFAFRPTFVGTVAGAILVTYAGGATAIGVSATGERSLVTHYYRSILGRAPDAGGRAFWEAEAARVAGLGANVNETWFAMAMSFYNSSEYLAFGRNATEYVRDLYNTFFNRTADDGGLAYWTGLIAQGMPREVVLVSFMFSSEFSGFAQAIFGNTAARAEVDTVVDFYRGLLSRLPDSSGFGFWVGQFRTAQCQGASAVYTQVEAISSAYANSPEYGARARSNSQYVGDLYNAFLRRGGDLSGVQFWIGQLDTGAKTREQVRQEFVASPEFSARVAAVVAQGCLAQ